MMQSGVVASPAPIGEQTPSSETPSPSTTLSTCLSLERSLSTASSISSSSARSLSGKIEEVSIEVGKRRGYTRPQATIFADSARNRDSVMSLGTIAHLQHYFARTGLLDGKGAQLAREDKDTKIHRTQSRDPALSQLTGSDFTNSSTIAENDAQSSDQADHPPALYREDIATLSSTDRTHLTAALEDPHTTFDLPPTVSTYKPKPTYVPPPPDITVLRRELREGLEDARNVLLELREEDEEAHVGEETTEQQKLGGEENANRQGWHEVQGLHVLDLVTLAIRAARNYYTAHEHPQRLYSIISERQLRSELYSVLDTLKRVATRNFHGGFRKIEIDQVLEWVDSINTLVAQDEFMETREQQERQRWSWLDGDWNGRELEREWLFLTSFDSASSPLSKWYEGEDGRQAFQNALRSGLRLVELHNELVRSSKRRFGEISTYHTDTSKPYRCAENLRYWIKAAELRWDVMLHVDVSGVVRGEEWASKGFEEAVVRWSSTVRREISTEWKEDGQQRCRQRPPILATDSDEYDEEETGYVTIL